jgi:outer membrane protein TolC
MAQKDAAEESLRISTRKRDAGEITQIEFLSAEQVATRARLGLINTIYQAQIDRAVWQFNNRQLPDIVTLNSTSAHSLAHPVGGEKP